MEQARALLQGKTVTIMGLGVHGGSCAAACFCAEAGARLTVTDLRNADALTPSLKRLRAYPSIRFTLGEHRLEDFENAHVVIKNPIVKGAHNIYLSAAQRAGARIETDISLFLRLSPAPLLAVSGSKGKSSTASALCYSLRALGFPAFLGGNSTVSPLEFVRHTTPATPVVLELSSWQLADLRAVDAQDHTVHHAGLLRPEIAIMTPIMADHQNWYADMESYVADKQVLYAHQGTHDTLLCNTDDGWGPRFACEAQKNGVRVFWYTAQSPETACRACTPRLMERALWRATDGTYWARFAEGDRACMLIPPQLHVPGRVLQTQVASAALAALLFAQRHSLPPSSCPPCFCAHSHSPAYANHASPPDYACPSAHSPFQEHTRRLAQALESYTGIEHRLEFFYEKGGLRFYNDSASTVPEATIAALEAFDESVVLIVGGTDKNADYQPLAQAAAKAHALYLLAGSATARLQPLLHAAQVPFYGPFTSLEVLLQDLRARQKSPGVIVFSPGAASFELFAHEFERGTTFKSQVRIIFE